MGNILGFIIPIALAVTQPQLFGIAFKYLQQGAGTASKKAKLWNIVLRSILARFFWRLAMFASFVELVLAYFIAQMITPVPWYGVVLAGFLTVGQFAWAYFNYKSGARKTETVRINGEEETRSIPEHGVFWGGFRKYSVPIAWLAVTSFGFLAQGALLEYYALTRVDNYGDQQVIILLAFLSKVMYGTIAITSAKFIGGVIVKGVRLLERSSTIIAKMIVSMDLNIEYNKNALEEIGGELDFLNEEDIDGKINYAASVLFTPMIILDLAIFIWPSQIVAVPILFGIIAVGLLEFVYGGMGIAPKAEAKSDRIDRMRIVFKLLPMTGIIIILLSYGGQSWLGQNLIVVVENFCYGIISAVYRGFWFPLFVVTPMLILASWRLRKLWRSIDTSVKARELLPQDKGGWLALPMRYTAWSLSLLAWTGSAAGAFLVAFSAFASGCGGEALSLSSNPVQEAINFENVRVNGNQVTNIDQENPWPLSAPDRKRVVIKFDTPEKAYGAVVFSPPSAALEVGMDSYAPVQSFERKDKDGKKYHHHTVEFDVPDKFSGSYRLVMRNAHLSPQTNPYYGKVARSEEFDHTLPEGPEFYDGWWGSIKAFWNDLWADDDNYKRPPPRTVIVRTETKPRPRGNSSPRRCTNNCKLTPLKVAPGFEDKVAAARNKR